jgi:hypothetical protein
MKQVSVVFEKGKTMDVNLPLLLQLIGTTIMIVGIAFAFKISASIKRLASVKAPS